MRIGTAKKLTAIMICFALALTLAACGAKEQEVKTYSMSGDAAKYAKSVDEKFAYEIAKTLAYDDKYLSCSLGYRTAGSDAEHAAADYLSEQMKSIGLNDVTKEAVTVDKWQFNR